MRKALIAVIAATMLLGCGKDSTGPDGNVNPNPDPQRYTITVNGDNFAPNPQLALIGDWIVWEVDPSDTGEHRIEFTDTPDDAPRTPTDTLTAGQKDSVSFLVEGTYKYVDQIEPGDTGVVIISPLP